MARRISHETISRKKSHESEGCRVESSRHGLQHGIGFSKIGVELASLGGAQKGSKIRRSWRRFTRILRRDAPAKPLGLNPPRIAACGGVRACRVHRVRRRRAQVVSPKHETVSLSIGVTVICKPLRGRLGLSYCCLKACRHRQITRYSNNTICRGLTLRPSNGAIVAENFWCPLRIEQLTAEARSREMRTY